MQIPSQWYNSEEAQEYMRRNPNSFIFKMFGIKPPAPFSAVGSNNAGGVMPQSTPSGTLGGSPNRPIRVNFGTPGIFGRQSSGGQSQAAFISGSNNAKPPSFAAGGMMSPQGRPIRPGAVMQPEAPGGVPIGADAPPPLEVGQIDAEASAMLQQNPELVERVQEVMAYAIQTGEMTPDELNMAVQLAKTALANPASYPQVRQFAIQNGLGTEQDIPQQLDKGLLFTLIATGKAMQNGAPAARGQQQAAPSAPATPDAGIIPSYREGGMTGDTPHIAKLHAREYIVPEDALIYHGKKHFDKLVEQARTPPDGQQK